MRDGFAHYLLGTEAFLSVCLEPESAPYAWLWHQGPRRLAHEGIVISAASLELADARLKQLREKGASGEQAFADRCQEKIDTIAAVFRDQNCIVPITDRYLRFARHELSESILYVQRHNTAPLAIGHLEKVVLATAILGVHQPMWLVDYAQDAFSELHVTKRLAVGTFPHPAKQQSSRAATI